MEIKKSVFYFVIGGVIFSLLANAYLFYRLYFYHQPQSAINQERQEKEQLNKGRASSNGAKLSPVDKKTTAKNPPIKSQTCPPEVLPPGYKLATSPDLFIFRSYAKLNPHPFFFNIDLDSDGKKEKVRVLISEIDQWRMRSKPVIVQVLEEKNGCLKEVFRFGDVSKENGEFGWRNGNEIGFASAEADFWGDGRDVFVFAPIDTGYGSGHASYLNILTFDQGEYKIIEGPKLTELSQFNFSAGAAPGRAILVATGIWNEGEAHFSAHYCQVDQWLWQKGSYVKKELFISQQKYEICDAQEILAREMH